MENIKYNAKLVNTRDGLEVMIGTNIVPNPEDGGTPNLSSFINYENCINHNDSHCSMFCPCEYACLN